VSAGEELCLACGLCCDGTLFGHVRLGAQDDPRKLKALGLPVSTSRSEPPINRFRQPCSALCADRRCRVYTDRPTQCRTFECRVFQDLRAGRLDPEAARRRVIQARRRASRVRALLRKLGDTDEHHSLDQRFRKAHLRMESGLVDAAEADLFAQLTQAVHALHLLAHDAFYTRPAENRLPRRPSCPR